ncbi:hypothetical protein NUSPORA_01828 [Nucleospora cyclopteri]
MLSDNFKVARQFYGLIIIFTTIALYLICNLGFFIPIPFVPQYSIAILPAIIFGFIFYYEIRMFLICRRVKKQIEIEFKLLNK